MWNSFFDAFGHYMRLETVCHISKEQHGEQIILINNKTSVVIEEQCNPFLMFFHIGQKKWMKPNSVRFEFQDKNTESLWLACCVGKD